MRSPTTSFTSLSKQCGVLLDCTAVVPMLFSFTPAALFRVEYVYLVCTDCSLVRSMVILTLRSQLHAALRRKFGEHLIRIATHNHAYRKREGKFSMPSFRLQTLLQFCQKIEMFAVVPLCSMATVVLFCWRLYVVRK